MKVKVLRIFLIYSLVLSQYIPLYAEEENLKWLCSFTTVGFDTVSGELEAGQYALNEEGDYYYFRDADDAEEKQFQTIGVLRDSDDPRASFNTQNYTQVRILGKAYYHIFSDRTGKTYRVRIGKTEYENLENRNAGAPQKTIIRAMAPIGRIFAAISHNATSEATPGTAVSSLTFSHTVNSGVNTVLFVGTEARDSTSADRPVTGITFNSDALTKSREDSDSATNVSSVGIWYRVAPDVVTGNVVISYTGTVDTSVYGAAETMDGVSSTPVEASNTNTSNVSGPVTVDVTTLTDGAWILDMAFSSEDATFTVGADQTERQAELGFSGTVDNAGMSTEEKPTAGVVTMSWTIGVMSGDRWVTSSVAITPSGAVAPVTPQRRGFWIRR